MVDAKYEEKYNRILAGLSPADRVILARNTHPVTNSEIRAGIHKDDLLGPGDIEPFPSDPFIAAKWNVQKDLMNMPDELKGYNTKHRFETGILRSRVYYPNEMTNPDDQNNPYIRSTNGNYLVDAGDSGTMHLIRAEGVGTNALKYSYKQGLINNVDQRNFQNVGRDVFHSQPAAYSLYGLNKAKVPVPVVDPESIGFDPKGALLTHAHTTLEGRDQTIGHYEPSHQFTGRSSLNLGFLLPRMAPRSRGPTIALATDRDREGALKQNVGTIGRSGDTAFFVPQDVADREAQEKRQRGIQRESKTKKPSSSELDARAFNDANEFKRERTGRGFYMDGKPAGGWYLG